MTMAMMKNRNACAEPHPQHCNLNHTLHHAYQKGFSLIEIAIALAVLGLIALVIAQYWSTASRVRSNDAQQDIASRAQTALVSFAYVNNRLPCPAADSAGIEALNCPPSAEVGRLPWRTLGLPDATAGAMRYGVYRNTTLNTDLALNIDRFAPLVPDTTISQTSTPFSLNRLIGNANLIDLCAVLTKVAALSRPMSGADHLQTIDATTSERRNIAFALALPGFNDADGDGNAYDGNQISAAPIFDQPSRPQSANYDDKVIAMSPQTLFAALSCGQGFAAAGHSHFNVANTTQIMAKSMDDYRFGLILTATMAAANVVSSIATIATAAAGLSSAVATSALAAAQILATFGALSPILIPSVLAIAANTAAVAASIATTAAAIAASVAADIIAADFVPILTKALNLATLVRRNAFAADAAGF